MKKFVAGRCERGNIFDLVDPTGFREVDFEAEVVRALACLQPDYRCGVFAGTFALDGERRTADLALMHRSLSHWFVVEVELAEHSLEHHVLPQVRCFRYGEPEPSCIASLARAFEMEQRQAETLLRYVPMQVAVVSNLPSQDWVGALRAIDVQLLTVSVFRNDDGLTAHQIDGRLSPRAFNLGFARYSAVDNSLRIPKTCDVPRGRLQIIDQFGNATWWVAREEGAALWISKERGHALLAHESYVQIIRDYDGRLSIRPST
jgi:hypothetical protein